MNSAEEYKDKAKQAISDLEEIKSELYPKLSDVKVKIDKDLNPDLYQSVVNIFGERNEDDPNKDFITFDMYLHCLQIIKLGGQDKAQRVLRGEGIV